MRYLLAVISLLSLALSGCGGINTFTLDAQSGSTVSVAAGWRQGFTRDNITVTITDATTPTPNVTVYTPGDSRIRAVTNMYPDPVSSLVVDTRVGDPSNFGQTINDFQTAGDDDWWQTLVILDLPLGMTPGPATIRIDGPNSEFYLADLNVLSGTGSPNPMQADFAFGAVTLTPGFLDPMDRPAHFTLNFSGGAKIPHAIEVMLTHAPDSTAGGTGRALAINPRGEIKTLSWSDDGTSMHVIMLRSNDLVVDNIKDFKFYVAGGVTSLSLGTVTAYDDSGTVIPGVVATCTGGCI